MCVSGGKKCLFFGNFGVLCFLGTPVLRFALLPYYRLISNFREKCDFLNSGNHASSTVIFEKLLVQIGWPKHKLWPNRMLNRNRYSAFTKNILHTTLTLRSDWENLLIKLSKCLAILERINFCLHELNKVDRSMVAITEAYLQPCQTSKIKLFVKIVNYRKLLTIFTKSSINLLWRFFQNWKNKVDLMLGSKWHSTRNVITECIYLQKEVIVVPNDIIWRNNNIMIFKVHL